MIQRLGKYKILSRIGRGGMGTVYKSHDPMLDRIVALKVIAADADLTDDLRTRFFREAQACARLSHPNVVTVYDMGEDEGHLYIVMEFLEGEELREVIAQRRQIVLENKIAMMLEISDGLDYAHRHGIIHRDIKPGNIFVLKDGHIKLLDFGIARIASADAGLTRTGLIMGTLRYMSPEQARGRADHRSDIFSTGAVFYEFLTYQPAFAGQDPIEILDRLRSENPVPITDLDPSIPADLAKIIERSLQKDPSLRYPDLSTLRVDLERIRHRLAEDSTAVRRRITGQLEEITALQTLLSERIGESFDDQTVPMVDDRTPSATLTTLERKIAGEVTRLRQLAAKAEALEPQYQSALDALRMTRLDNAVQILEALLQECPEHTHARRALSRAREVRQQAEEAIGAALTEAAAALQAGQAPWTLARLAEIEGRLPEAPELVARVAELREAAGRAIEAERARQEAEAARRALEQARARADEARGQAAAARREAEEADAARYDAGGWNEAADKDREAAGRYASGDYAGAAGLCEAAVGQYRRAATRARERAAEEERRIARLMQQAAGEAEAWHWAEALARLEEVEGLRQGHGGAAELRASVVAAQAAAARERERIEEILRSAEAALQRGELASGKAQLDSLERLPAAFTDLAAERLRLRKLERTLTADVGRVTSPVSEGVIAATPASRELDTAPVETAPSRPSKSARGKLIAVGLTSIVILSVPVIYFFGHRSPTVAPTIPPTTPAPTERVVAPPPPAERPVAPPAPVQQPDREAIGRLEQLQKQVTSRREAALRVDAERRASQLLATARSRETAADELLKSGDLNGSQQAYREALAKYEQAEVQAATAATQQRTAEKARDETGAARRSADIGEASRFAEQPWKRGLDKQRAAEKALANAQFAAAEKLFDDAKLEFRAAEKAASENIAAAKERAEVAAVRQKLQTAEEAAAAAANARRGAEQAAAARYAAAVFGAAQRKEDEGRQGLERKDYEAAASRLRDATRDYQSAAQEAQRAVEAERQTLLARQRQEAEQAALVVRRAATDSRAKAHAEREQAAKLGAETLVRDAFNAANAKEGEGDRLVAAQDNVAARQAYQEAAERYADAGRRARVVQEAKGVADQARTRMLAQKERASSDSQEWSAAVAQERQAAEYYQRSAFREAGDSFAAATDLFAKAAVRHEKPEERRPSAEDEIRTALQTYVRAFETKDIALMQKIRPGLKADELRKITDSFEQSREYRVNLKIDAVKVVGDEASVSGRREDSLVSTRGQSFRNESKFTFRLKRMGDGWVISGVN